MYQQKNHHNFRVCISHQIQNKRDLQKRGQINEINSLPRRSSLPLGLASPNIHANEIAITPMRTAKKASNVLTP